MNIENLSEVTKRFYEKSEGKDSASQILLWDSIVEQKYCDVYEQLVWSINPSKNVQETKKIALKEFLERDLNLDLIIEKFDLFENLIREKLKKYNDIFPNFTINTPIYALPTMGKFNGRVGSFNGNDILLFGLDTIVSQNDNEDILYSHEMFHVYHAEVLGNSNEWDKTARLTFPLWLEGLATLASSLVANNFEDSDYLMDEELAMVSSSDISKYSKAFIDNSETLPWSQQGFPTYSKWFLSDSSKIEHNCPNRIGYKLGLDVVREILKTSKIEEVVSWDVDKVHVHVLKTLSKFL